MKAPKEGKGLSSSRPILKYNHLTGEVQSGRTVSVRLLNILCNDLEDLASMFPCNLDLNVKGMDIAFPFFFGRALLIIDKTNDSDVESFKGRDSPGTS